MTTFDDETCSQEEYEQMQEENHYYNVVDWFVFYMLEYGPKKVGKDVQEALDRELLMRLEEKTWTEKDMRKFEDEIQFEDNRG